MIKISSFRRDKMTLRQSDPEYQCLLQTIYAGYNSLPPNLQQAIVWVLKNRTTHNRPEWGGYNIISVCRKLPCWNGRGGVPIPMHNRALRNSIESWLPHINRITDPTGGAVMFHNPVLPLTARQPIPSGTEYILSKTIGQWNFYKLRN